MITFQNVSKKFAGGVAALVKVSFSVEPGEFVFLIGPSGAGKTTLLKLLIGETRASSGKIIFNDRDITKSSKKEIAKLRRKIRMVFQDFKILHDRTVLENVLLALNILGKKGKDAENEAKKILKLVGLEEKYNFFPMQISAGELQRVSIARALAGEPKVLLADEPTGNLDPATGKEILKLLSEINADGTTVMVTTHNAQFVDQTKKRVIALDKGELKRDVKEGTYAS